MLHIAGSRPPSRRKRYSSPQASLHPTFPGTDACTVLDVTDWSTFFADLGFVVFLVVFAVICRAVTSDEGRLSRISESRWALLRLISTRDRDDWVETDMAMQHALGRYVLPALALLLAGGVLVSAGVELSKSL